MKHDKLFLCICVALYANFTFGKNTEFVNEDIGFEINESISQWKLYTAHSQVYDYNNTDKISWVEYNNNDNVRVTFARLSEATENGKTIKPKYGSSFFQLGNSYTNFYQQKILYTFIYSNDTKILEYSYFMVMQDPGKNHDKANKSERPYFKAYAEVNSNIYSCSEISFYADTLKFLNFLTGENGLMYSKDWESRIVDFSRIENIKEGDSITISFITSDCLQGGHYGYAYIDAEFVNTAFSIDDSNKSDKICLNDTVEFSYPGAGTFKGEQYKWYVNDYLQSEDSIMMYYFIKPGKYTIKLDINVGNDTTNECAVHQNITQDVEVVNCFETECNDCPSRFAPKPGEKYLVSGWVSAPNQMEGGSETTSFENVYIEIRFDDNVVKCMPAGNIIDGWQRISQVIEIPASATIMTIALKNDNSNEEVYFDDIRFHPFNASMKSYVYDPETLRLSAELDDENYATFYDYDEEGALVRVRKETERGVMTIQEARQSSVKIDTK